MSRSVVWLLALAACDSVFGLNGRSEKDAALDDAQAKDSGPDLDAPPLLCTPFPDPLDDADGDEILNQNDRCPTLVDRGYNEDGDCEGDRCDLCPQDDATTADLEGDGVGDRCDLPGNSFDVARMEGFGDIDEIVPLTTGWTLDTTAGTLSGVPMAGGLYAFAAESELATPFLIETQIRIPDGIGWHAGIVFGATGALDQTPTAFMVAVTRINNADARVQMFRIDNGSITLLPDEAPVALAAVVRLRVVVQGNEVAIEVRDGDAASLATLELPSAPAAASAYGIGVLGSSSATFDYLYEVHHQ